MSDVDEIATGFGKNEEIFLLRTALSTIGDAFQLYARHPSYCKSNAPHLKTMYGVDQCDCGLSESLKKTAELMEKAAVRAKLQGDG